MDSVWQGVLAEVFWCIWRSPELGGCAEINIQQRCTQVKGRERMTA